MKNYLSSHIVKFSLQLKWRIMKAMCLFLTLAFLSSFPSARVFASLDNTSNSNELTSPNNTSNSNEFAEPDYQISPQLDGSSSSYDIAGAPSSQAVIRDMSIADTGVILELIETPDPEIEYNVTTERRGGFLEFDNPYGAAIEVTLNDSVLLFDSIYCDHLYEYSIDLILGLNVVEITVTSEDGSQTNVYKIFITREPSSKVVLEGLGIDGVLEWVETPELDYDLTTLRQRVPLEFYDPYGAITEIMLNGTVLDPSFEYSRPSNGAKGCGYWLDLIPDSNVVNIKLSSPEGPNTITYVINITRNLSSVAVIKDLYIQGILSSVEVPEFEYNLSTELLGDFLYFDNPYGATTQVTLNNVTVTTEDDWYWLDFVPGLNVLEIEVSSSDGTKTNTYVINIERILSSRAVIEDLYIGGVLDWVETPEFEYNLSTEHQEGTLSFENPYDASIEITFNGTQLVGEEEDNWYRLDLVPGMNVIKIKVTSADGTKTNTYVINITRNLSSKAVIEDLYIDGVLDWVEVPEFEYNVTTEIIGGYLEFNNPYGAMTEVTFNGIVLSGDTYYRLEYAPGMNVIEIKVTSADGTKTNTYVINIERILSSRAVIENLYIGGVLDWVETPEFEYNVTTELRSVYLQFENPYGAMTEVTLNDTIVEEYYYSGMYLIDFTLGMNVIEIKVTSADKTSTNNYKINVTYVLSSETAIENLSVSEYGSIFSNYILDPIRTPNPETEYCAVTEFQYGLLEFDNPHGATAKVRLNGSELGEGNYFSLNFATGENLIEIEVTSSDGKNTTTYRINITRNLSSQATLENLDIQDILRLAVPNPETEYSCTTERKNGYLEYTNRYNMTVEITLNGSLISYYASGLYFKQYQMEYVLGMNVVEIKVTSEDGKNTNIYRINITRATSSDAVIKDLYISEGVLSRISNPLSEHSATTMRKIGYLSFDNPHGAEVAVTFNGSVLENGYGKYRLDFNLGLNVIEINLTSSDGTITKTYVINVTRNHSSKAVIEYLYSTCGYVHIPNPDIEYSATTELSGGYLSFQNSYGATTEVKLNGVVVLEALEDNYWLDYVFGLNVIEINVTSSDGTTSNTYRLNVTRNRSPKTALNNLTIYVKESETVYHRILDNISTPDPDIEYSATTERLGGTLFFNNAYGAMTVVTLNGVAVVEDDGHYWLDFSPGLNVIEIKVTSNDGSNTNTYRIRIVREATTYSLQEIAEGIPNFFEDYSKAPYIGGALERVEGHVATYLGGTGELDITPTVVEITGPEVQADGTTYVGQYKVTLTRGTETASKTLTYTQTKKVAGLQGIADGIPNLAGEYQNAPYINGALTQVRAHVKDHIGVTDITYTVVEITGPEVQADGTTYVGQYKVTLTRGTETASKTLTYTQTKRR